MAEIKLRNGDCMEAMAEMPDKAFDLAIVDPPYGIGGGSRLFTGGRDKCLSAKLVGLNPNIIYKEWDNAPPPTEYFVELRRVSKHQIIWGANHFISKMPLDASCWLVWDKLNGKYSSADCEMAWTSFPSAVRKFEFKWAGFMQDDMKNKEIRFHPTQKPVKLYEWLLKNYAKKGDKILDTHLGSGSSAIAAYNLDFDFTGIELDRDYYKGAVKRLENHKRQARLFDADTKT